MNFRVSDDWDDTRTLSQMIDTSKFGYLYKKKDEPTKLANGDYGRVHLVFDKSKTGLIYSALEDYGGGLQVDGDGISGHEFISEASKTFDLCIYNNPEDCIAEYLRLTNLESHILS